MAPTPAPDRYPDRVARAAAELRPVRVLLTVVASPFYAAGFVAALVWLALVWFLAAAQVGWVDARSRGGQAP